VALCQWAGATLPALQKFFLKIVTTQIFVFQQVAALATWKPAAATKYLVDVQRGATSNSA
jgi:hypothetical protein